MKRLTIVVASGLSLLPRTGMAQIDRIGAIDRSRRVLLKGNVHPKARPEFDEGPVEPSKKLNYVALTLKPSPQQQAALEQLLQEQQDRSSPNYHKWLTPEQYADRFGLSANDIGKIRAWLASEGFTVVDTARGRNWIAFDGTAEQVSRAFRTEIHYYGVDGERLFANASAPSIPAALQPLVTGFVGLDDFGSRKNRRRTIGTSRSAGLGPESPQYTDPNSGAHALAPDDLATIYNVAPLYAQGYDGSGQKVAIIGESGINVSDIRTFRNFFGLPANDPQLVPVGQNPGMPQAALSEAELDIEWIGAVARRATVVYVYSQDAITAAKYVVDQNIAPVVSMSIGFCETPVFANLFAALAQQANAQGVTWLAATGDTGAAGCDSNSEVLASSGLQVQLPASSPGVTAVGGTEFNDLGGKYWSAGNSATQASALSYIPEFAWNDSPLGTALDTRIIASSGGYSTLFPQPSWQASVGLPPGSGRALPDISLTASPDHDPYWVYSMGRWQPNGGTSASTPSFAGIVALLNQYEHSNGQGNINPNLYRLAQAVPNAFHDITTGSDIVPCVIGTPNCVNGPLGYALGYYARPGYDPVTGLGSVDAYNLVTQWNAGMVTASDVVPSCTPDPVYEQQPNAQGDSWIFTLTLTETAGVSTTLTGFTINGADHTSLFTTFAIPANGSISANIGARGLTVPMTVVFGFTGVDAGGRQWSTQLSVPFLGFQSTGSTPVVNAVVSSASFLPGMAAGGLATVFGTNLSRVSGIAMPGGANSYQGVSVTVGGIQVPLFAVANVNGLEQINFQVPTQLATPAEVQIQVNNNGSIGGLNNVQVTLLQPGIFEYVPAGSALKYAAAIKPDGSTAGPFNPAARGSTVSIYLTGLGPTSPPLSTGQPGPVPPATTNFKAIVGLNNQGVPVSFSGAAPGFIGLDQVNFEIPVNGPVGTNVKLSVGVNGIFSQDSRIAIQ